MNIVEEPIERIKPYANNPRKNDEAVDKVARSLKDYGFQQPIVCDKDGVIIVGHTRLKAAQKLGLKTVPVVYADLPEDKANEYRLVDNKTAEFADWDLELLDIELGELPDFDAEFYDFDIGGVDDIDVEHTTLTDAFIAPPFSILDTRQGYWQDRKAQWKSLGIKSEVGRGENLLGKGLKELADKYNNGSDALQGTSIFDPVLCEVMYKWFCIDGGSIYDCFAGGSVRGVIASYLGYNYTGIDIRQEQVDANYENASDIGVTPVWYCDDSLNADKYIEDNSVDMVFTCPPYADLEVYSDLEGDISNMDYEDFCKTYRDILTIAERKLKDNRFYVVVVGDVRDKNGAYRQLVDYTRKVLTDAGLVFYNDIVLIEVVGTGAVRAKRQFLSMRKVIKTHQNVLVFYKGKIDEIKNNYHEIEVADLDEISDTYS